MELTFKEVFLSISFRSIQRETLMLALNDTIHNRCFDGTFILDTSALGPTDWVTIPLDASRVSAQLKVLSTASVTLETTLGSVAEINADTAYWVEWPEGALTGGAAAQDVTKGPVTAIRLRVMTALAGNNAILNIKAQRG